MVETHRYEVATAGQGDAKDLTPFVTRTLAASAIRSGIATVFVVGSTAGVTTIEFESGVVEDLNHLFDDLAPRDDAYRHHLRWHDDNGSSHVRAGLLGPSVTIPFTDGALLLGTWQQVVLLEFDTRDRQREVIVQLVGD